MQYSDRDALQALARAPRCKPTLLALINIRGATRACAALTLPGSRLTVFMLRFNPDEWDGYMPPAGLEQSRVPLEDRAKEVVGAEVLELSPEDLEARSSRMWVNTSTTAAEHSTLRRPMPVLMRSASCKAHI